jgi:hypothetical protein
LYYQRLETGPWSSAKKILSYVPYYQYLLLTLCSATNIYYNQNAIEGLKSLNKLFEACKEFFNQSIEDSQRLNVIRDQLTGVVVVWELNFKWNSEEEYKEYKAVQ